MPEDHSPIILPSQAQTKANRPSIIVNGINPFWLLDTAEALFDQDALAEGERFTPLLPFQKSVCILAALYRFLSIAAPSQSGKTTIAEVLAAVIAYAYPGENVLLLSTRQEQSERLLRDIRNKLIKCCKVPSLRKLSTDSSTTLEIAENRSQIIALPHSINALTGNPARFVILDELAKYDKEPDLIYAEAVARTGKTGGQVIDISSMYGEGRPDPKADRGFSGSFFHYKWSQTFEQRRNPEKQKVAVKLTYHVSPYLVKNIETQKEAMKPAEFDEHHLCIPRKVAGKAVFEFDFKREDHVKTPAELTHLLDPSEPLFLCFDPGLNKAAVLGQVNLEAPRVIYLKDFLSDREKDAQDFIKSVIMQCRRDFPAYEFIYFADVAARKENDQTSLSWVDLISSISGQFPITQYQHVAPGIQTLKSFMRRRNGFYVSTDCTILAEAFESGLVHKETRGVAEIAYVKDGYYEHIGDCARYPIHYLTGGFSADSLGTFGAYEITANPNANNITGY